MTALSTLEQLTQNIVDRGFQALPRPDASACPGRWFWARHGVLNNQPVCKVVELRWYRAASSPPAMFWPPITTLLKMTCRRTTAPRPAGRRALGSRCRRRYDRLKLRWRCSCAPPIQLGDRFAVERSCRCRPRRRRHVGDVPCSTSVADAQATATARGRRNA